MSKRNFLSIGSWVGLTTLLWVIAWIIAEAIPVFNNLLSLIVSFLPGHVSERQKLTVASRAHSLPAGSHVS